MKMNALAATKLKGIWKNLVVSPKLNRISCSNNTIKIRIIKKLTKQSHLSINAQFSRKNKLHLTKSTLTQPLLRINKIR